MYPMELHEPSACSIVYATANIYIVDSCHVWELRRAQHTVVRDRANFDSGRLVKRELYSVSDALVDGGMTRDRIVAWKLYERCRWKPNGRGSGGLSRGRVHGREARGRPASARPRIRINDALTERARGVSAACYSGARVCAARVGLTPARVWLAACGSLPRRSNALAVTASAVPRIEWSGGGASDHVKIVCTYRWRAAL